MKNYGRITFLAIAGTLLLAGCSKSVESMCEELVDAAEQAVYAAAEMLGEDVDKEEMARMRQNDIEMCMMAPRALVEAAYDEMKKIQD